jgi:HSF-type DNA-binding
MEMNMNMNPDHNHNMMMMMTQQHHHGLDEGEEQPIDVYIETNFDGKKSQSSSTKLLFQQHQQQQQPPRQRSNSHDGVFGMSRNGGGFMFGGADNNANGMMSASQRSSASSHHSSSSSNCYDNATAATASSTTLPSNMMDFSGHSSDGHIQFGSHDNNNTTSYSFSPVPNPGGVISDGGPSSPTPSSGSATGSNSNKPQRLLSETTSTGIPAFPWKLHDVLEDSERKGFTSVVSWQMNGRAFKVHDQKVFESQIMSRYFNQTMYKSFQRQLNIYGFQRVTRYVQS